MNAIHRRCILVLAVLSVCAAPAPAQSPYPVKPIRWVIPFPTGGTADVGVRIIAAALTRSLGQNVIVDNRPGAGGVIAAEAVARAPADGYTVFNAGAGFAIVCATRAKLPFDVAKDFSAVARLASNAYVFSVHPGVPAKSMKDLVALARARPGQLSFASAGTGSGQHLVGEMLKLKAGIKIDHVPYQGGGPSTIAVLGGHVPILVSLPSEIVQHVTSGKLRALAVTDRVRVEQLKDVPTMVESGWPDFEMYSFGGVVAPAATPKDIVTKLSAEIVRVLQIGEVRESLAKNGYNVAPQGPEAFDAFFRGEIQKYRKLVKEANINLD